MSQARRLATAIPIIVLAGVLVRWAPSVLAPYRADRTARQLVRALHERDSATMATISASGSANNWLCIQRHFPTAFWTRAWGEPTLERLARQEPFHYRTIGDPLPGETVGTKFEFFIPRDRPDKVESFFVDARTGVWTPAVHGCLRQGGTR